jgi:hypothetical protein
MRQGVALWRRRRTARSGGNKACTRGRRSRAVHSVTAPCGPRESSMNDSGDSRQRLCLRDTGRHCLDRVDSYPDVIDLLAESRAGPLLSGAASLPPHPEQGWRGSCEFKCNLWKRIYTPAHRRGDRPCRRYIPRTPVEHGLAGIRSAAPRPIVPARRPVEVKRRVGRGAGCGRGPSAFFTGGTRAAGAPQEPAVTDIRRAIFGAPRPHERWRQRPGPADTPALSPAQRRGRLLETTRGRWRLRQAAAGPRRERCLRMIPRYTP